MVKKVKIQIFGKKCNFVQFFLSFFIGGYIFSVCVRAGGGGVLVLGNKKIGKISGSKSRAVNFHQLIDYSLDFFFFRKN